MAAAEVAAGNGADAPLQCPGLPLCSAEEVEAGGPLCHHRFLPPLPLKSGAGWDGSSSDGGEGLRE